MAESGQRSCGSCTLCCKIMAVDDLSKPRNQWCRHCIKGKGCELYESRPQSCRDFDCLWLQGHAPETLHPIRCHAVLGWTTDGKGIVVHVDPGYPGAHQRGDLARFIDNVVAKGLPVIVAVGERRTYISRDTGSVAV